jgi:hypothetical protein
MQHYSPQLSVVKCTSSGIKHLHKFPLFILLSVDRISLIDAESVNAALLDKFAVNPF